MSKVVSSIFGGGGGAPAPQPVPVNPVDDGAAQEKRLEVERNAIADQKMRGRSSLIKAGGDLADTEQQASGMLKQKQRQGAASKGVLG